MGLVAQGASNIARQKGWEMRPFTTRGWALLVLKPLGGRLWPSGALGPASLPTFGCARVWESRCG